MGPFIIHLLGIRARYPNGVTHGMLTKRKRQNGMGSSVRPPSEGLIIIVGKGVACQVIAWVIGNTGCTPIDSGLLLSFDALGPGKQSSRRNPHCNEWPVIGATIEG